MLLLPWQKLLILNCSCLWRRVYRPAGGSKDHQMWCHSSGLPAGNCSHDVSTLNFSLPEATVTWNPVIFALFQEAAAQKPGAAARGHCSQRAAYHHGADEKGAVNTPNFVEPESLFLVVSQSFALFGQNQIWYFVVLSVILRFIKKIQMLLFLLRVAPTLWLIFLLIIGNFYDCVALLIMLRDTLIHAHVCVDCVSGKPG